MFSAPFPQSDFIFRSLHCTSQLSLGSLFTQVPTVSVRPEILGDFLSFFPSKALGLESMLNLSLNQSQEIQSTSFEKFYPHPDFAIGKLFNKQNWNSQNKLFWQKPKSGHSWQAQPCHTQLASQLCTHSPNLKQLSFSFLYFCALFNFH